MYILKDRKRMYECDKCHKCFKQKTDYKRHQNRITSCVVEGKIKSSVDKIDNAYLAEIMEKLIKSNEDLVKKVGELESKVKSLEKKDTTTNINNNTLNLNLVGYGNEDLSKFAVKEIVKVLQGFKAPLKLTELTHFNPKYPEYQNVYISNIKDKYAMYFDGNKWKLTTKEELIDKIYDDKKNYIEENLEKFIKSLSDSGEKALRRWLDTPDNDKKISNIKDGLKLMLYNNRPKT